MFILFSRTTIDTLTNLKTFLAVARTGSFAAAARELKVAPSVVTKRIGQIEWRLKAALFERSTRRVALTAIGQRHLPAVQRAVADVEGLFTDLMADRGELQGPLRIKSPGTLAVHLLGPLLLGFQQAHPRIDIELLTLDRAVNPVDEGFDLALTLMPDAYPGVVTEPLCPMPRVLCAAPAYLARAGVPMHPRELAEHAILNFLPMGTLWAFDSATGPIQVRVRPHLGSNQGQLLLAAALAGQGLARLSAYQSQAPLADGRLVRVLPEFPLSPLWLKALVPESRLPVARVQALLEAMRQAWGAASFQ